MASPVFTCSKLAQSNRPASQAAARRENLSGAVAHTVLNLSPALLFQEVADPAVE